jgi:hypothetical protein
MLASPKGNNSAALNQNGQQSKSLPPVFKSV